MATVMALVTVLVTGVRRLVARPAGWPSACHAASPKVTAVSRSIPVRKAVPVRVIPVRRATHEPE
jgi:hypothetical protein